MFVHLIARRLREIGTSEGWALKPLSQINHTGWMTAVAPADRPKSVRNSCVVEYICSVFVSFHLAYSVNLGACHTAASDLFPFLLIKPMQLARQETLIGRIALGDSHRNVDRPQDHNSVLILISLIYL